MRDENDHQQEQKWVKNVSEPINILREQKHYVSTED